jgi:hypothetical protein
VRRCVSIGVLVALAAAVIASVAFGFWSSTGASATSALAATLNAPTNVAASASGGSTSVSVSWTAPSGLAPTGYYVTRATASNPTPQAACGTSRTTPTTSVSCSDSVPGSGVYTYTVVAFRGANGGGWTASATASPVAVVSQTLDHFAVSAPSTAAAGSAFSVTATAKDASNATIAGYSGTVHFTSSDGNAVLPSDYEYVGGDNGSHTFTSTLTTAGSQNVSVTDTSETTKTGSATVTVAAASAAKVAFGVQPTTTAAAQSISPAPTVRIQDQFGNTVTTSNANVTAALGTNPSSGALSGTKSVAAVNGVATFTSLSIDKAGTGYTLTASTGGLAGDASSAFNVKVGAATRLAFTTQPSTTPSTAAISPAVVALIQDAGGNTVTTSSANVTVAIGTNPAAGTLGGTKTVAASNGAATFTDLSIDKAGTGYTITASSTGLTGATSSAVNITQSKLVITSSAMTTTTGTSSGLITVERQDSSGSPIANASALTVNLSSSAGTGGFRNAPDTAAITSVSIPSGSSTATFRYRDSAVGRPTITATATGHTSATQTVTVNNGAAAGLAWRNVKTGSANPPATSVTPVCTGTVGSTYACTVTLAGSGANNAFISANVAFGDSVGNAVAFSPLDQDTFWSTSGNKNGDTSNNKLTIAAGTSTSAGTVLSQMNGQNTTTITATFAAADGATWTATLTVQRN